jgi:hypothetical protein
MRAVATQHAALAQIRASILALLLLWTVAACGTSPAPTTVSGDLPSPTGATTDLSTPSKQPDLSLSVLPANGSAGKLDLALTLRNDGEDPVYLGICGPWQIYPEGDPDRPVWLGICEVDYLGHRVGPRDVFEGTLRAQLDAGTYRARVLTFGDCTLGPPQEVSAEETNYGAFGDCAVTHEVTSAPIIVE